MQSHVKKNMHIIIIVTEEIKDDKRPKFSKENKLHIDFFI